MIISCRAGDMMRAPPWRTRWRLPDQASRRQPRYQRRIQREHPNKTGRRARYQDLSQPAVDYNVPLAATQPDLRYYRRGSTECMSVAVGHPRLGRSLDDGIAA
jgi:hypothetical protein